MGLVICSVSSNSAATELNAQSSFSPISRKLLTDRHLDNINYLISNVLMRTWELFSSSMPTSFTHAVQGRSVSITAAYAAVASGYSRLGGISIFRGCCKWLLQSWVFEISGIVGPIISVYDREFLRSCRSLAHRDMDCPPLCSSVCCCSSVAVPYCTTVSVSIGFLRALVVHVVCNYRDVATRRTCDV